MKLKVFISMVLTLFLASTLTMTFKVQPASSIIHRSFGSSEPPATEWNKTYGGTKTDWAESVIQTSDGGYAIAGYTKSFGAGREDFWLVKTDAYGSMVWNKTYGGTRADAAFSVQQTSDGGYIIAGITRSFGAGEEDFWLVKVASEVPPVGGKIVPVNKLELLMPYIGVAAVILVTSTAIVINKRER